MKAQDARPIVLVTGSAGLIGRALCRAIIGAGYAVREFDLRASGPARGDVRDANQLAHAMSGCDGIVHLAAVSRVVTAEANPGACRATNVDAVRELLDSARQRARPPWVLFASSREVYGDALNLPVHEDSPLAPRNVYARSKQEGERLVQRAASAGLCTAIVRLSNVYGSVYDHPTRVVPAFAHAAATRGAIRVDGPANCFDFTHVDDVVRGLMLVVHKLAAGASNLPALQFATGRGTTLAELADLARRLGGDGVSVTAGPPSPLHARRFIGSWDRARAMLGWEPACDLATGLGRLVAGYRAMQSRGYPDDPSLSCIKASPYCAS